MNAVTGRCFQVETMGAVDGPGLRLVLFLQGCPLRCPYCHNPESWANEGGRALTVEDAISTYRRYEGYYRQGGITLSGGEPLSQSAFAAELLRRCRAEGIHTALDTSGCVGTGEALAACDQADLLLLDVKTADPVLHREAFGFPLEAVTALLERREAQSLPVWIRHVVAPGLTDTEASMDALADLLAPYSCIQRVELLPFRTLCLEKYRERGLAFPLADIPFDSLAVTKKLRGRLSEGLPCIEVL